jgi:ATP-dependent Clp protease ATP-binding subunit ClpA
VGKTATALELASLLGGANNLIRVDCNTLQGSGYDSGPAINRLIGAPPGYVGYARGQGGLLSRVRDCPQSVVLFDEFEKADPGVGELLLRILDDGRAEDHDGNVLDFRKTFIVFTSNAGCVYDARGPMGFVRGVQAPPGPRVEVNAFWADLRRLGLGQEFQGRIPHQFFFKALGPETIQQVLMQHLAALAARVDARGLDLSWDDDLVPHLMARWHQHLGARSAAGLVRGAIEEQLRLAASSGELDGVRHVRVRAGSPEADRDAPDVSRARTGDALEIVVA